MQRTRAQPLVWGDAMCGGTVKPVRLEHVLRSKRRHHDQEPADREQRMPCAAAKAQGSQKKKDQSLTKLPGAITLSTLVKVSQREQPLAET